MKNLILIFMFSIFNFTGCKFYQNYKNEVDIFNGFVNLENKAFTNLTINGKGKLNKINVTEILDVNGNLQANNSEISSLKINGKIELINSVISGKAIIYGTLNAKESTLQDIEASSTFISLNNSKAQNIVIKDTNKDKYIIELDNASIVFKDIIFEGKNGQIKIKDSLSTVHGKVIGGQIIKK